VRVLFALKTPKLTAKETVSDLYNDAKSLQSVRTKKLSLLGSTCWSLSHNLAKCVAVM